METPIVTLTTDWGSGGFFAGMVKGALYSLVDGVEVVDITHELEAYNILPATFVVRHACLGFPPGTVHIVDVGSAYSAEHPFVCVKARGQYFLCVDNGLPAMALGSDIEDVSVLPTQPGGIYNFAAYNLFVGVVRKLAAGATMRDIGPQHTALLQRTLVTYMPQGDYYRIYIHYIDRYGNAYLGMSYDEFNTLRQGRPFAMTVRDQEVTELSVSYHQQPAGGSRMQKLRLTVSATGMLELAIKESSMAQYIGLRVNEAVLLKFKE